MTNGLLLVMYYQYREQTVRHSLSFVYSKMYRYSWISVLQRYYIALLLARKSQGIGLQQPTSMSPYMQTL